MSVPQLQKRIELLEVLQTDNSVPDCDPNRRLAHCVADLEGRPWTCLDPTNLEKQARREADLARYRKYFDELGVEVKL